ncbi:RagB/SusD family nutrient uptake outer membrane protein [Dyadobacter sp. CY347]|uniref:RagB/SusD family nutrient uptake outer membrane protein n=1 Tax=Dyadobacter sp. CY347 TaxID=2909336 RepID=UPI001F30E4AF|nr:RagB/SusD family nutrient uptake outer membrane protein [Dyadobacter sp. CY347]MCF2487537.1 RagB/SusD family nutrient uptake outer membrane protein [Dyadobacter sp. CY347]
MKKFKLIKTSGMILAAALLWLSSCEDFLKEDPQDRIAQDRFYQTAEDATAAVNAVYSNLGSTSSGPEGIYHSTTWIAAGLASDELINKQEGAIANDQLATFSWNAENGNIGTIWRIHYKTITLANIAIERIPPIDMDEALKNRLVNEAKFLRALAYFNLVRMFGNVPLLVKEEEPLNPGVADVNAVYTQIISDLQSAEALPLDGAIQEGRATSGAAKALLAKVYLTRKDFQNASAKALEVIQSNKYALWPSFADAFKHTNRNGKEALFSVSFGDGGGSISFWEFGQFNVRLLPPELSKEISGIRNTQGWQAATKDLYNSFSDNDERKKVTFLTEFVNDKGATIKLSDIYIQKYWDRTAEPVAGDSQQDFPVIRYSDVLLTYAEAQAELTNAAVASQYVNMVRKRAKLAEVNLSGAALKEEILDQRRKEFVAEGHRWYDLVRTGTLEAKVQKAKSVAVKPIYYLFPLPQRERDVNPELPQNPGY